jgi:4-amino-4-deoxy-L-arabinose transferase-like glycosyltransferase
VISRFSSSEQGRASIILFGLWLFATAFNFDKAYHVDDTAYLEMARWISLHPLHPMSGLLSWGADLEAIHYTNQPPLYFYLMAAWGVLFGWSEIAMHVLMSVFTLWAIVTFYRLAQIVTPGAALLPTAFLALGPAFVVSQNTMVDIPLLAIWLEFFRVLLDPKVTERWRYPFAGLLCGIALLIKYTSLVLLPALMLHIVLVGGVLRMAWVLLPIGALVAWSGFNYWEYGGIHMAGRPVASKPLSAYLNSAIYWISVLGAITPFAAVYFYARKCLADSTRIRFLWSIVLIVFCCSYLFVLLWIIVFPTRHMVNLLLEFLFLMTGIGLLSILIAMSFQKLITKQLQKSEWMLLCWLVTAAGFVVVLAPFMAARHVLLALPPILLLTNAWLLVRLKMTYAKSAAIILTVLLTTLLSLADRWYADIYRSQAVSIRAALPPDSTVWFNGNWGWQWYAERAGMKLFSKLPDRESPAIGDYFVTTDSACCALKLPESLKLEPIETIVIDRATRIQRFASISFYSSGLQTWGYSYEPIEKFQISRVTSVNK